MDKGRQPRLLFLIENYLGSTGITFLNKTIHLNEFSQVYWPFLFGINEEESSPYVYKEKPSHMFCV